MHFINKQKILLMGAKAILHLKQLEGGQNSMEKRPKYEKDIEQLIHG